VSALRLNGLILSFLLILSVQTAFIGTTDFELLNQNETEEKDVSQRSSTLIDVPNWRIGDQWNSNGYLDVRDFIADSGVSTNVQTLSGTLDSHVTDIYTMEVDNVSTLVYKVESQGDYAANGVTLTTYTGDLEIGMDTVEIIRASDLASIRQEATIDIDFIYTILWWDVTIDVADLVVTNEYSPALENYDFPLVVGETWQTTYTVDTTYSGTSEYVTIPSDTSDSSSTSWEVMSRGSSGVAYSGCNGNSYNITTYNSNGEETGYRWYCPAINNDIKSASTESIGFVAVHQLNYYQQASRTHHLDVDIDYQLSPLDMDISVTVTVTNNAGAAVSDQSVEFRYEIDEDISYGSTNSNGQVSFNFNSGDSADSSQGGTERGSHGVIARLVSLNQVGASTISIDPEVHEVDLITNSAGVTVERTRNGNTISLNSIIGFTAIQGDVLTFSVPVQNKGILTSPSTEIKITGPDGVTSIEPVSSLPSLGVQRVEIDWIVPVSQPIGDTSVTFVVDENELITEDGNRSNNYGSFVIFIGKLPTAVLSTPAETLTLSSVTIDGHNSFDLDGGTLDCVFEVQAIDNEITTFEEEDCILEYSWDDDGEYSISLVVTDEESDSDTAQSNIIVNNRPPEITVVADSNSVAVESSITFRVTERIDLDSRNQDNAVDVSWQTECEGGVSVSSTCTVTPLTEGEYSIEVIAMDDDGETTSETITIEVTNIEPHNPSVEIWNGINRLIPNSYGKYSAQEGDLLKIISSAEDSQNDLSGLTHLLIPDAENYPDISQENIGVHSEFMHSFSTSGMHLMDLTVTDDDGESVTLRVPIEISNVAPTIDAISNPLPVAEDSEIRITISVMDTPGDLEQLVNCFDLDPETNSDGENETWDDCDITGTNLVYAWSDARTAPSSIVFHTTDDNGDTATLEIPITINNVKPTARLMIDNLNPTEGDKVILSANLTSDSQQDLLEMTYYWDFDTSVDSDGNGISDDDHDAEGIWVEWSPKSGQKTVKLVAMDESLSDSTTHTVSVAEKPFSIGGLLTSNGIIIVITLLILGAGGFFAMKMWNKPDVIDAPFGVSPSNLFATDDAFDDSSFDEHNEEE